MSRTDKDIPYRVKLENNPTVMVIAHSDDCTMVNGTLDCDAPPSVNADFATPHSPRTRCYWLPDYDRIQEFKDLRDSMPKHGCYNPRCTNCTSKKTLKRKTRNNLKKDLRREIEDF